MRETLADIGVRVRNIDSPGDELLVVYSLSDDASLPEFAVAAVMRLSEPLSDGAERIRLRNVRDGQTLLEVQVRPEQIGTILASTVDEAQRREIDKLLVETLAASGLEDLDVPKPQTAEPPPLPARVIQQGAVPIDVPGMTARGEPRQTRPLEPSSEQSVGDQQVEPDVVPVDEQAAAKALLENLRKNDLENLSIGRDAAERWIINIENRTWRSDMDALKKALDAATAILPAVPITVQIKRHDVVVSHVNVELADYVKLQADILSGEGLAENWQVKSGPAEVIEPVEVLAHGNESYLRMDLLIRPAIEYYIGLEHDPFESDYFLMTDATTTLGPGFWAQMRFPTQLTTNRQVALDRSLLGWVGRPVNGVLGTASGGRFSDQLYGYYAEARTDTAEHQFGIAGSLIDQQLQLNPFDTYASAFGYYQYDWGNIGLKARLGYGQFLENDNKGMALSLRRRFGESVIEARAIRTNDGDEGLTFEVSLPLGPRRASSPEDVRMRSNPAVSVDYKSNLSVQGDYLQGSHDLESFRGEISPAYLAAHGERLADDPEEAPETAWPAAPSYEGNSGLMRIPTADVTPDGRLLAGMSYFDREHSKVPDNETDAMPTFVGVGFLPNLELVGRLTFFHDVKAFDWNYNLDRSFNIHYQLKSQTEDWVPAVAVGAQDVTFGTTTSYVGEAEYAVGTWQRENMRVHLGLGSGRLKPVFGGFELALERGNRTHLITEYDSDYVNAGARWFLADWGTASIGLLGMDELTGSISFQTDLQ